MLFFSPAAAKASPPPSPPLPIPIPSMTATLTFGNASLMHNLDGFVNFYELLAFSGIKLLTFNVAVPILINICARNCIIFDVD